MHMMPRAWPSSSPACEGTGSFRERAASGDRQQRKAACSSVHLKGSRVCRMGGGVVSPRSKLPHSMNSLAVQSSSEDLTPSLPKSRFNPWSWNYSPASHPSFTV